MTSQHQDYRGLGVGSALGGGGRNHVPAHPHSSSPLSNVAACRRALLVGRLHTLRETVRDCRNRVSLTHALEAASTFLASGQHLK